MAGEIREARSPGRPKGKVTLHHLEVHPAKNKGHVVKHVLEVKFGPGELGYGSTPEPEEHVFGPHEGAEALKHIAKHAKIKVEEPENDRAEEEEDKDEEEEGKDEGEDEDEDEDEEKE